MSIGKIPNLFLFSFVGFTYSPRRARVNSAAQK
ncbi:unnamed protein product, partial [marine sediment metagenome]